MGFIRRIKLGIALTRDSITVMRNNPGLMVFPVVSGVSGLAYLAIFLGISFGFLSVGLDVVAYAALFLTYLGLTFISSFFTAGLVHQTRDAIEYDIEPSLRDGMDAAWAVRKPLFTWALISATVGLLINALENSDSRGAQIFAALFSIGWTLMTFFIIPVIVFEETSVTEMFTRSAGTFKDMWGEAPISMIGVQLVALLIALPFVLVGIGLLSLSPFLGIPVIFVGVLAGFLVGQTLVGVIKTTLYLYATEGLRPDEFDDVDFDSLAGA